MRARTNAGRKAAIREVIDRWLNLPWPEESLGDYRRFGKASALLYSFLNREVMTPCGRGILLQVLGKECYVAFYANKTELSEKKPLKSDLKGGGKEKYADGKYFWCWEVEPLDAAAATERGTGD